MSAREEVVPPDRLRSVSRGCRGSSQITQAFGPGAAPDDDVLACRDVLWKEGARRNDSGRRTHSLEVTRIVQVRNTGY